MKIENLPIQASVQMFSKNKLLYNSNLFSTCVTNIIGNVIFFSKHRNTTVRKTLPLSGEEDALAQREGQIANKQGLLVPA